VPACATCVRCGWGAASSSGPRGVKLLASGRKMQQFEIFAEHLEPLSEPARGGGNRGGDTPSDGGGGESDKVPF
jgi:hypothetical protein